MKSLSKLTYRGPLNMDYQLFVTKLKYLDDCLSKDDLVVLKFLCKDIIKTFKLDNVSCPLDLFDALESAGAIGADKLQLVAELLFEAQRIDLMKVIGISTDELRIMIQDNGNKLNGYRRMLHQLSEQMITADVKQLKRIMKNTPVGIHRARLEEAADAYSLFSLLEKQEMICTTDVFQLKQLTDQMDEAALSVIVSKYIDEFCKKPAPTTEMGIQCNSLSSTQPSTRVIQEYSIRAQTQYQKGICLIINNEVFEPSDRLPRERKGSSMDEAALVNVFTKLSFKVEVERDMTAEGISTLMKKVSCTDHSSYDIFVCCILTHGEAGKVFGTDGLPVTLHSMLSRFTPKKCKTLENKPKIFFVQACQGGRQADESLDSIPQRDGPSDETEDLVEDLEMDFGKLSNVTNIPRQPDFLLGLATVPGFVSYRSKSTGSWYIQALCDLLEKLHNKADLLSILTEVNDKVIANEKKSGQIMATQMPLPQHTLRKRIYLRTL